MDPFFVVEMLAKNDINDINNFNYTQDDSPEYKFFTILFILAGCIYFSTTTVSLWYGIADDDDIDSYYNDIENYKLAFFDEYNNLQEIDHTADFLKELGDNYIKEETPMGDIYMTYNVEYHSFWYFADRRSIPYGVLDTVARKFAIENNCKSICINYKNEYDKALLKHTEDNKEEANERLTPTEVKKDDDGEGNKEDKVNPKKNVFATLKSYNKNKKEQTKKYVLVEQANRFTFKGFTVEWIDPKTKISDNRDNKIKELNFDTFKREVLINYS